MSDNRKKIEAPPEKVLNIRIQPPLIFAIFMLLAIFLHKFAHELSIKYSILNTFGFLISICGIIINMWSMNKYRKYKTSSHPKHQAFKLIQDGPYKFSRNPLYLGNWMMIFGFGFGLNILWISITSFLALLVVNFFVVLPEERYMYDIFGEDYKDYSKNVRRWL
tara:strand:- start:1550 stop:2041 length:492 start_codon:yes stop_codon:yes gene_type:complete